MDTSVASQFYNAIGVPSKCDPNSEESRFAVDPIFPQLSRTIKPGMRVLDLGCGAGRYAFVAEELGAVPVGIDCAAVPLEHARQVAQERGSYARFVEGDYCALPFPPSSFDAAIFINNIVECSYDDIDTLLRQLQVILVPDGLLLLTMPDKFHQHQQGGKSLAIYDPSTGKADRVCYTADDGEEFQYQSYFWTVFFARYVCSRYMTLCEEEILESGGRWFVFKNSRP